MKTCKHSRFLACILFSALLLVAACETRQTPVTGKDLTRAETCAVDGMILLDHAGPKAQIVWKDGTRSFYCEAREAFPDWLDSIKQKKIAGFFVQNFENKKWQAYKGNWIDARKAVFVIDSRKQGAMGVSYVSFASEMGAHHFQQENGGKILSLNEITADMLQRSGELQRNRIMGMPGMQHSATVTDMSGHNMEGHTMGSMMRGVNGSATAPVTTDSAFSHHAR